MDMEEVVNNVQIIIGKIFEKKKGYQNNRISKYYDKTERKQI